MTLALSPDSKWLAAGGNGSETSGCIRIWDLATGELKHTKTRSSTNFPKELPVRIAFSQDGQTLFALGQLAESDSPKWCVQMWDAESGTKKGVLAEREGSGRALALSSNGEFLAVGTYEGEVVLIRTSVSVRPPAPKP